MLGRMQCSADFERVLATPPRARSAHFAAHHLARAPGSRKRRRQQPVSAELSTGGPTGCTQSVDDLRQAGVPDRCWFGTVMPKRLARRASTRNLLRRQIRAAMERHHQHLPLGLWLVRLRAPFDPRQFRSAAARALGAAARLELDALLSKAA